MILGARFNHTDASLRKLSIQFNRKLLHSTTNASTSVSSAATSGSSVLPTAATFNPAHRSIAAAIIVVVVLPSVPVTASIGRGPPMRCCSHS